MSSPFHRPRWSFFTIFLFLLNDTHGFLYTPVARKSDRTCCCSPVLEISFTKVDVALQQARLRAWDASSAAAAEGGNNKKKKKKNGPTFGGKIKKTKRSDDKRLRTGHEQQLTKASQRANVVLPSHKSNAPPWQVLSSKEAKKNVEVESRRRELAKQGIVMEQDEVAESTTKMLSKTLLSDADRQLVNWKRFNPSNVPTGLTFIGAYLERRLPPRIGVPEIAFLGRSNVGKSSLLNRLASSALGGAGESDGARVGKTPGATASVNLYAMMGSISSNSKRAAKAILGLVDLPGFGYAKLSKEVQESVQMAAERYLGSREELALGILLVDARRVPSDDDRAVLAALYDLGLPLVVVATKIDKLAKNELEESKMAICDRLGLPEGQPLCISSVTGEGTKELWKIIMEACEVKVEEIKDKLQRSGEEDEDTDGAIEYDDLGNLMLPDDDGEELVYDQGYDWIQDSAVMYAYGAGEIIEDGAVEADFVDEDDENDLDESNQQAEQRVSFKSLKKMARRMEERGEV